MVFFQQVLDGPAPVFAPLGIDPLVSYWSYPAFSPLLYSKHNTTKTQPHLHDCGDNQRGDCDDLAQIPQG